MDSYTLINKLRKARRSHTISAGAQGLYYELVAINNEERWSETFKCTAMELCAALNVSEKTVAGYREELMRAELVAYVSGKNKRTASVYCLFGSRFGSMVGSNIYYQKEYQSEHQTGEKTPDLLKQKSKSKTETKTFVDDDAAARAAEIENAIDGFCNGCEEEKEKKVAPKKEKKPLPTTDEMVELIIASETCHWRNVIEFYLAKRTPLPKGVTWDKLPDTDKQLYFDQRYELFKKFYAGKQDNYQIRLPTCNDIAQNFYNWVPTELNREKLQALNNHATSNAYAKHKNTAAARNERNGSIDDIIDRSTDFLQQYSG